MIKRLWLSIGSLPYKSATAFVALVSWPERRLILAKVTYFHFHICKCGDKASGGNKVSGIALILRTWKISELLVFCGRHGIPLQRDYADHPLWPKVTENRLYLFHYSCIKTNFTFGFRFPNQNQTRNCWQNYVDFHRCQKLKVRSLRKLFTVSWFLKMKGEDYEPCNFFAKNFQTVCPNAWIEKWNEQREKVNISLDFLRLCQARWDFLDKLHSIHLVPLRKMNKMNNSCLHHIYHSTHRIHQICLSQLKWP